MTVHDLRISLLSPWKLQTARPAEMNNVPCSLEIDTNKEHKAKHIRQLKMIYEKVWITTCCEFPTKHDLTL